MTSNELPIFKPTKLGSSKQGLPFLRLGFRPFYLGGTLFAAMIVPVWIALFLGQIQLTTSVAPLLWHAHEMLFGFVISIIVGFLLTAGKNWTGLATPRGWALGALALLWLSARVTAVTGPYWFYMVLDMTLLPLVTGVMVNILLRSRNYRNLPLALILALLAVANAVFHLAASEVLNISAITPLYAALGLIVMIESVMTGRLIPSFTMAVIPGLKLIADKRIERLTLGLTGLGLTLWVFAPASLLNMLVLLTATGLHLKRGLDWQPRVTKHRPVLWILHAAYAWFPVGLALLALAQIGWVSVSLGVHALAVGATGGLIIGMVTRTGRGHTGRPIQVAKLEVAAYLLMMLAAMLRVFLPLIAPKLLPLSLIAATTAWSAAFVLYLWVFTPWLMRVRLDGKDG